MTMATTAEWICTRCGSTNRRLVADGGSGVDTETLVRRALHLLTRG